MLNHQLQAELRQKADVWQLHMVEGQCKTLAHENDTLRNGVAKLEYLVQTQAETLRQLVNVLIEHSVGSNDALDNELNALRNQL